MTVVPTILGVIGYLAVGCAVGALLMALDSPNLDSDPYAALSFVMIGLVWPIMLAIGVVTVYVLALRGATVYLFRIFSRKINHKRIGEKTEGYGSR